MCTTVNDNFNCNVSRPSTGRYNHAMNSPANQAPDNDILPDYHHLAGKSIHFVGIGGCGMCGLARLARQYGAICSGSDISNTNTIESLRQEGFDIRLEQTDKSIPDQVDCIVHSAAVDLEHLELVEASRRGIPILKYAQMLGRLMIGQTGIAIAGTHGKSTTTSMLSFLLLQCGFDPSFIVGAKCDQIGGGSRCGNGNIIITEACEYDRSFHNLNPTHATILNVEADHLDVYHSLEEIIHAFAVFARQVPIYGTLLINHEMNCRLEITAGLNCRVQSIGFALQADWQVDVRNGKTLLKHRGESIAEWTNPLPGEHMAYNAAAAAVLANRLGAAWTDIVESLPQFKGLDRRMQKLGKRVIAGGQVTVVDDYGHHPTEIDTTLRALRRYYCPTRLICVFQPHQHSRTRFLMQQFAASFNEADMVIVPDIYFVRDSEQERHEVNAEDLVNHLRQKNVDAMHLHPFERIVQHLDQITRDGDLVVTMGAGDIWKVAAHFLNPR